MQVQNNPLDLIHGYMVKYSKEDILLKELYHWRQVW